MTKNFTPSSENLNINLRFDSITFDYNNITIEDLKFPTKENSKCINSNDLKYTETPINEQSEFCNSKKDSQISSPKCSYTMLVQNNTFDHPHYQDYCRLPYQVLNMSKESKYSLLMEYENKVNMHPHTFFQNPLESENVSIDSDDIEGIEDHKQVMSNLDTIHRHLLNIGDMEGKEILKESSRNIPIESVDPSLKIDLGCEEINLNTSANTKTDYDRLR